MLEPAQFLLRAEEQWLYFEPLLQARPADSVSESELRQFYSRCLYLHSFSFRSPPMAVGGGQKDALD